MPARPARSLLVAAVVAGLCVACTGDDPEQPSPSSRRPTAQLVPQCPPPPPHPRPTTAERINRGVAAGGLPGWQAADIGASARLGDGRIVWLFGDTLRTQRFDPRIVANSMILSSRACISQVMPADQGPVIPDGPNGTVHWPMSVAVTESGKGEVLVVLSSRIDRGGSGAFDFTYLGSSAAVFTVEPGGVPRLTRVVQLTPTSRDPQQVNWGAASLVHGDWFYVYGTRLTGRPADLGRELHVARAPLRSPADRDRWQFWGGGAWQPDHRRSAPVLASSEGVSQTLSVDAVGGRIVAVSKRGGDLGDFVYEWTSPAPQGPWTPHQELRAPGGFDTGDLQYAPLAHPEVPLRSGSLLVSVSRNTTDLQRLMADPRLGRPRFVEVPRG